VSMRDGWPRLRHYTMLFSNYIVQNVPQLVMIYRITKPNVYRNYRPDAIPNTSECTSQTKLLSRGLGTEVRISLLSHTCYMSSHRTMAPQITCKTCTSLQPWKQLPLALCSGFCTVRLKSHKSGAERTSCGAHLAGIHIYMAASTRCDFHVTPDDTMTLHMNDRRDPRLNVGCEPGIPHTHTTSYQVSNGDKAARASS
jgi:hypothetical protein